MLRGEIRRYRSVLGRPGQPTLRLVLSADHVNRDPARRMVITAQVLGDDPAGLLHPQVGPSSWAALATLQPTLRSRLDELVGQATADQMESVGATLGALLDIGTPRTGEIRAYRPLLPTDAPRRLILSAAGYNRLPDLATVIGAHVVDDDGGLLHVSVDPGGWAAVDTVQPILRSRLDEVIGGATTEQMVAVDAAPAALLDLG